jgi:hypothetical protein
MGGPAGGFNFAGPIGLPDDKNKVPEMVKQPVQTNIAEDLAPALERYRQQQLNASSMPSPDQVNVNQASMTGSNPLGAPNQTVANKRAGNFAMSLDQFMKNRKGTM